MNSLRLPGAIIHSILGGVAPKCLLAVTSATQSVTPIGTAVMCGAKILSVATSPTSTGTSHYSGTSVFCASMADVFDIEVPQLWRDKLWLLINQTPNLDWQILTKRIGNVKRMFPRDWNKSLPNNVWLGISIVNQEEANRDIPKLLKFNGVRWLSIEPQLAYVYLTQEWLDCQGESEFDILPTVNWVVVGGESGPKARPFKLEWARSLMKDCRTWNTPFFMKQAGSNPFLGEKSQRGFMLDTRHGANPDEWPKDLRVREFPR